MNKILTQEVFKDVPEWVKSVAVDSDGYKIVTEIITLTILATATTQQIGNTVPLIENKWLVVLAI